MLYNVRVCRIWDRERDVMVKRVKQEGPGHNRQEMRGDLRSDHLGGEHKKIEPISMVAHGLEGGHT
jgi:hypothetical protein